MSRKRYPNCYSVIQVNGYPSGQKLYLAGWTLRKQYTNHFVVSDGASTLRIHGIPMEHTDQLNFPGDALHGLELYVTVERDDIDPMSMNYMWSMPETILRYFEPEPTKCNCGASHTSFADHHSEWCDVELEK